MKRLLLLFIIIFSTIATDAQTASIKGVVTDTLNKQNLSKAVVSLLKSEDTVLYTFTRTNNDGDFMLTNIQQGKYIVLVTHPGYADYYDTIAIASKEIFTIGTIKLTTKAHLLEDVIVVQKIAAVRMKGDTLVYKADSFKVKPGASVEDLLKQFPGIQVDKSGNITAQGTRVDKVLVDGEEFFGDDPTIATKNLNADMVNEVQVFDKKSDQATFTGVDDGQTSRTINLKLKDNIKKGWFGKLETATGLKDIWNNSLMANSFKNKRKLSFYGIASSTGKTGLNWDESGKFGNAGISSFSFSDDGDMFFSYNRDDLENANYWGEGIPKSWNGGINYANKFNNDKQQINGSYRYAKLLNEGIGSTRSQSILPDTLFFNNEQRKVFGIKDRHSLNGTFDVMIDSFFSVKTIVNAYQGKFLGNQHYYSEALNDVGNFVNTSNRVNNSSGDNQNINTTILLRKKFKKVGRTLSLNINPRFSENNSTGFLYAENNFYAKSGTISFSDTTNQKKITESKTNVLNTRLSYTEQLVKDVLMEVNYGLNLHKFRNKILSYDKDINGKYENLNNSYSNNFDYTITTNLIGSMIRYNKQKINFSAGGNISFAKFNQTDLIKDTTYTYNYTNIFPRVNFIYKFNGNKRVTFDYFGNTKQPTIQQIQPVADNNNPLYIQVGNPDLKQEFNHRFTIRFNNYQVFKNRGYYGNVSFSTVSNAIRSNNFTDTLGRTVAQYVNLNGNYNYGASFGYNIQIPNVDIDFNASYSYNANNNVSIVNHLQNITKNNTHSFNINLSKEKEKVYNIWLQASANYHISSSSIRPEINTKYWTSNIYAELNVQLPWKLEINNELDIELRQATPLFTGNNNITVWNAYIGRKIFKNDKSSIRFSAFDILNQNKGYTRYIGSATLTENSYQKLSQYFLLSFIWNFTKGGTTSK